MRETVTGDELLQKLKTHLDQKQAKNKRFTASALARQIGILDSTLHKLLRGERKLGLHLGKQIATYLDVGFKHAPREKKAARLPSLNPKALSEDLNWMHLAVLELLQLKDFTPSSDYVAQRLGLKDETAARILQELKNSGLLQVDERGNCSDRLSDSATAAKQFVTSKSLRQLQRDMLEKSLEALEGVDYEQREHASTFTAIDPKLIPQLKKKMRAFRWEIATWIDANSTEKSELYILQTHIFPITKLKSRSQN
ncbi:MAG: DUF4423 domain-containing protein [Proteobacteria bacterium]|nr:MAG: DUF4423 domain-containing protein [Pseudomonadota bacterium]